jgi:hypothetical protein
VPDGFRRLLRRVVPEFSAGLFPHDPVLVLSGHDMNSPLHNVAPMPRGSPPK